MNTPRINREPPILFKDAVEAEWLNDIAPYWLKFALDELHGGILGWIANDHRRQWLLSVSNFQQLFLLFIVPLNQVPLKFEKHIHLPFTIYHLHPFTIHKPLFLTHEHGYLNLAQGDPWEPWVDPR
jgi:hypothetical protein